MSAALRAAEQRLKEQNARLGQEADAAKKKEEEARTRAAAAKKERERILLASAEAQTRRQRQEAEEGFDQVEKVVKELGSTYAMSGGTCNNADQTEYLEAVKNAREFTMLRFDNTHYVDDGPELTTRQRRAVENEKKQLISTFEQQERGVIIEFEQSVRDIFFDMFIGGLCKHEVV